jgi:cystathionine gamma-synthase
VQRVAVDDTAGWIRASGAADLIWLESPSNPLLTVSDLDAVRAAPRKPGALVRPNRGAQDRGDRAGTRARSLS